MNFNFSAKRYKVVIALGILCLIAGFTYWSRSTNQADIVTSPPKTVSAQRGYIQYPGSYFTFSYSSTYKVKMMPAKDDDLEVAMLNSDTNYEKRIAVVTSNLVGGSLQNNSAYKFRKTQTEQYISSDVNIDRTVATVFRKTDGLEQTIFIPHGNSVAIISFSMTGSFDNLQLEVDRLISTFQWKE